MIHRQRKERKRSAENISHNSVSGHGGSVVAGLIGIKRCRDEDTHVSPGERHGGYYGGDPVSTRPRKPKKPHWKLNGAQHGAAETLLGGDDAVVAVSKGDAEEALIDKCIDSDNGEEAEQAANNEGDKNQDTLLTSEVVDAAENVGEGGEERVENCNVEGDV